jgi:hypothetical protein
MKITTLWVQYPSSYPGETAPTLWAAVDEYAHDDNPDYFNGKVIPEVKALLAGGEIVDYTVADIDVPDAFVNGLFARHSIAVDPQRAALKRAWNEGREALAAQFTKPLDSTGVRPPVVNPYEDEASA